MVIFGYIFHFLQLLAEEQDAVLDPRKHSYRSATFSVNDPAIGNGFIELIQICIISQDGAHVFSGCVFHHLYLNFVNMQLRPGAQCKGHSTGLIRVGRR